MNISGHSERYSTYKLVKLCWQIMAASRSLDPLDPDAFCHRGGRAGQKTLNLEKVSEVLSGSKSPAKRGIGRDT